MSRFSLLAAVVTTLTLAFRALCLSHVQAPGGNMTKFLNRLLGAHVKMQSRIFSLFCALLVRPVHQESAVCPLWNSTLQCLRTLVHLLHHVWLWTSVQFLKGVSKQEREVSTAKREGTYDEGGIMAPSFGDIHFVSETVRSTNRAGGRLKVLEAAMMWCHTTGQRADITGLSCGDVTAAYEKHLHVC